MQNFEISYSPGEKFQNPKFFKISIFDQKIKNYFSNSSKI